MRYRIAIIVPCEVYIYKDVEDEDEAYFLVESMNFRLKQTLDGGLKPENDEMVLVEGEPDYDSRRIEKVEEEED